MIRARCATHARLGAGLLGCVLGAALALGGPRAAQASSSVSRDEDGALVLYLLLKELGYQTRRITDLRSLNRTVDVLVALGEARGFRTKPIEAWLRAGGAVVFAPPLIEMGYCEGFSIGSLKLERRRPDKNDTTAVADQRLKMKPAACQLAVPKGARVLIAGADGKSALAYELKVASGQLLVVAHDDLLANKNIAQDDLIVVIRRWLAERAPGKARVAFLEERRAGKLLEMLQRAQMGPVALHGLALLLLFYWILGPRFGESQPEPRVTRREFAQHARALGHLYLGAGAAGHALARQYERFIGRALGGSATERSALPATRHRERSVSRGALAALLATRTGRDPAEVESLLAQIEYAIAADAPPDAREMHRHFRLSHALAELQRGSTARSGGKRARAKKR